MGSRGRRCPECHVVFGQGGLQHRCIRVIDQQNSDLAVRKVHIRSTRVFGSQSLEEPAHQDHCHAVEGGNVHVLVAVCLRVGVPELADYSFELAGGGCACATRVGGGATTNDSGEGGRRCGVASLARWCGSGEGGKGDDTVLVGRARGRMD